MSSHMPPGWHALQDPHGRWYYHHAVSNTTQWHPPAPHHGYAQPPPPPYPSGHAQPHHHHGPSPAGYPTGGRPSKQPAGYPSSAVPPGGHHHSGGHAGRPSSGASSSSASGKYVYNEPKSYKLKEKLFSLSGDSFQVKDASSGATAFKIKGNVLSFGDSKKLLDPSGSPIYKMSENLISLRGRMNIVDSRSNKAVVTLRKKGFIPMLGTGTVQVWRGGSDNGSPWLQVKGDFFRKDFRFQEKSSGRTVATVSRKSFNLSNIVFEKDSYVIRVEPGQDAALMVFLVVALDEQYRDDGNRTGLESRLGGFL